MFALRVKVFSHAVSVSEKKLKSDLNSVQFGLTESSKPRRIIKNDGHFLHKESPKNYQPK